MENKVREALQLNQVAWDAFGELLIENKHLECESEQLRAELHGLCSACVHNNVGLENEVCRNCGDGGENWKWRGDEPSPCITQRPMSCDEAEEADDDEVIFIEYYATEEIKAQEGYFAPDAISFLRKTLYNIGIKDGIVCGFRCWRSMPSEAERAVAHWQRI